MANEVTIVECPRDAWQGLRDVIPTEEKVQYLSRLIALGFRHIDAVSFVSPKHVPQMADSEAVMARLTEVKAPGGGPVEIIGIVVNTQGLERALATPGVTTVGYPYSISAYFRRANANMSRAESRALVEKLQHDTKAAGKKLVIYISMAFGNPYEEPWGAEIVEETLVWLKDLGVRTVSLADTVGRASPEEVACVDASRVLRSACICTAGRIARQKKYWQPMRRAAVDLTGRSPGWADARSRGMNWLATFPRKPCSRLLRRAEFRRALIRSRWRWLAP
jgi:hydroxymethylglutaryl-CoA lyase